MMDNESDMVIFFVSHKKTVTLLKFGQILMWQKQKLQIPIFMVYKSADVQ